MTVKELITELNKIEDKDMSVKVYSEMHDRIVTSIHKTNFDHSVRLCLERIEVDYEDCL